MDWPQGGDPPVDYIRYGFNLRGLGLPRRGGGLGPAGVHEGAHPSGMSVARLPPAGPRAQALRERQRALSREEDDRIAAHALHLERRAAGQRRPTDSRHAEDVKSPTASGYPTHPYPAFLPPTGIEGAFPRSVCCFRHPPLMSEFGARPASSGCGHTPPPHTHDGIVARTTEKTPRILGGKIKP